MKATLNSPLPFAGTVYVFRNKQKKDIDDPLRAEIRKRSGDKDLSCVEKDGDVYVATGTKAHEHHKLDQDTHKILADIEAGTVVSSDSSDTEESAILKLQKDIRRRFTELFGKPEEWK